MLVVRPVVLLLLLLLLVGVVLLVLCLLHLLAVEELLEVDLGVSPDLEDQWLLDAEGVGLELLAAMLSVASEPLGRCFPSTGRHFVQLRPATHTLAVISRTSSRFSKYIWGMSSRRRPSSASTRRSWSSHTY